MEKNRIKYDETRCEYCQEPVNSQSFVLGGKHGTRIFCCYDCKVDCENETWENNAYPPYDFLDHDFSMNY